MTTDVVGGVWDFSVSLASQVQREGHRVHLLIFGEPSYDQWLQCRERHISFTFADLRLEWMDDSVADVATSRTFISRLIAEFQPDILHVNQYGVIPEDISIPTVLTSHSDVFSWRTWNHRVGPENNSLRAYRHLVLDGLRRADQVVAISHFVADQLVSHFDLPALPPVIHNGWAAPSTELLPLSERCRQTLLAGRVWDEAKNVSLAVRAAQGWDPGAVLLAGSQVHPDNGSVARIEPPIQAIGFQTRVRLDRLLAQTRIVLAPARYEPFGLLPLQAAMHGCALLLSDIPSFREIWHGAAMFFRSNDVDDLRLQWQRLLNDDDLAGDLTHRAWKRATDRYTLSHMAGSYLDLYQRLQLRPDVASSHEVLA